MKKTISIFLLLIYIACCIPVFAALPTIPSNTTVSFPFSPNTMITSSEHNSNNTDLKTGINETKQYLRDLETHIIDRTGTNTLTGTITASSSGDFIVPTTPLTSTSAVNKTYCTTLPNGLSATSSTTYDFNSNRLQAIGAATTSTDAIQYQQAVKATGNVSETITGDKTASGNWAFSNAVTLNTTCSSSTHSCPKSYIDAADSAITAGGASFSTSLPSTPCTQGAQYNYYSSSGIFHYVCTSSGGWVQARSSAVNTATTFSNTVGITGATTISSSGNLTVTGANSFTGTHTVTGTSTFSSSGVFIPDATLSTQAASYGQLLALTPRKFAQTTAVTVNNTTPATLIGAGSGSYSQSSGSITVPANTFSPGTTLKITASGVYTRGTGTLDLALGLGGQSIGAFSIGDPGTATTNSTWRIESIVTNVTTGSPGTFYGQGLFWRGSTGAGTNWNVSGTGSSSTFNLTTSSTQDITFTATWSATAGSITCTNFVVEVI